MSNSFRKVDGVFDLLTEAALGLPLRIDPLQFSGGGMLGMCHFPGRQGRDGRGRLWRRSVEADLDAIRQWGASAVVSLVEEHEFEALGVPDLGTRVQELGLRWHHWPIRDMDVPEGRNPLAAAGQTLLERLGRGERVVVHCAAGLGRTGTVAATMLVAFGEEPAKAIARVRQARPETLETSAQERFVHQGRDLRPD